MNLQKIHFTVFTPTRKQTVLKPDSKRSLQCNHSENVNLSLQCLDSVNNTVLINGVWHAAQMPRHYETEQTDSRRAQKWG